MPALHRAGHRLVAGHRAHLGRARDWVTERQTPRSSASRIGVLAAAGYVVLASAFRSPTIMWGVTLAWLWSAWRAGRGAQPPAPAEVEVEAPETPQLALARWLAHFIGDAPGVHLRELYPAMRALPGMQSYDDAALRQALRELNIPVTRSLRIGGIEGRSGIRLADVTTLLSPDGGPHPSQGGDAGQAPDSPPGERPESAPSPTGEEVNAA